MELKGFFEKHTETYEKIMNPKVLDSYKELLLYHKSALVNCNKILESGAGNGHLTLELLISGADVTAIDINEKGLNNLRKKIEPYKDKTTVLCIDGQQLPFENNFFDGISSMLVLPFIDNPRQYLEEHIRTLENGGIFVISGPDIPTGKIIKEVMKKLKENIMKKPIWQEIQENWNDFETYTIENVDKNIKNRYSIQEICNVLEGFGLKIIDSRGNPQFQRMGYCVTAQKP
jgi:ubiquinone/menaquinone biosynthesis C-methylase UbiE